MVFPLLVMISGAMSGAYETNPISLYPKFLIHERALWSRFLDARYGGIIENFKMAWSDPFVDFYEPPYPVAKEDEAILELWQSFLRESGEMPRYFQGLAFTRPSRRDASLENSAFRHWLIAEYGTLDRLNDELLLGASRITGIIPPIQSQILVPDVDSPLLQAFDRYLGTVPASHLLPWDVGGFYRGVYLPAIYGNDIAAYNQAWGTHYASYRDLPFTESQPMVGAEPWFQYVRTVLNSAFVRLTPAGEQALSACGLNKVDFIRTQARPTDVQVQSIDIEFSKWAAMRGVSDARIPQRALDWKNFQAEQGFWRWQFAKQNFSYVIEEVLIYGNGVRNTVILVFLSIAGALTINPMAAYALSRFKIGQSHAVLLFFLATIAFPAEVAMIPGFLQIKELGMINTFWALIIPGLVNGFSIFLLKGFFDSLPKELYEAADIDGASEWQIFWGITMNMSKPILAVMALGAFSSAYGAFMFALILVPDQSMWTLMVWIYQLQQNAGSGIIYASILLTAVPTLLVYLCTQHIIMRGLVIPSEK